MFGDIEDEDEFQSEIASLTAILTGPSEEQVSIDETAEQEAAEKVAREAATQAAKEAEEKAEREAKEKAMREAEVYRIPGARGQHSEACASDQGGTCRGRRL